MDDGICKTWLPDGFHRLLPPTADKDAVTKELTGFCFVCLHEARFTSCSYGFLVFEFCTEREYTFLSLVVLI